MDTTGTGSQNVEFNNPARLRSYVPLGTGLINQLINQTHLKKIFFEVSFKNLRVLTFCVYYADIPILQSQSASIGLNTWSMT